MADRPGVIKNVERATRASGKSKDEVRSIVGGGAGVHRGFARELVL